MATKNISSCPIKVMTHGLKTTGLHDKDTDYFTRKQSGDGGVSR